MKVSWRKIAIALIDQLSQFVETKLDSKRENGLLRRV
jgi:hypothetical protein